MDRFCNESPCSGDLVRSKQINTMENDFVIRNCKPEDLMSIVSIYNEAVPLGLVAEWEPITVESRRSWLDQHLHGRYPIWVLEDGHTISAWLSFSPFLRETQAYATVAELSLYVAASARRKGIGEFLVRKAIYSREAGFGSYVAHVNTANKASISLLGKVGFQQWGLLPEIYTTPWGQAVDLLVFGLQRRHEWQ